MNQRLKLPAKRGFALLITLVVVSVVLAIGLSLLFVTTKQYLLAVTANESEKAFSAAQIGLECMRYWRAQPETREQLLSEGSQRPALSCAGETSNVLDTNVVLQGAAQGVWMYGYKYRYTIEDQSCVDTSLYIADYRESESDDPYTLSGEGLGQIECTPGTICTVIFSRGYNRPCPDAGEQFDSIYTIQREITVEY